MTVSVCGDGHGEPMPFVALLSGRGRLKFVDPLCTLTNCRVEDCIGALLDELTPLVQRLAHVVGHRSNDFGDKPRDEPSGLPLAPRASWSRCCRGDSVPKHRSYIVRVAEVACSHQTRE